MTYTEYEMDMYSEYMYYVEEVIKTSNIPNFIKNEMILIWQELQKMNKI